MSNDLAELGFKADSSQLRRATTDLDNLDKGADKATRSSKRLREENKKSSAIFGRMGASIGTAVGSLAAFASATVLIRGAIGTIKDFDQSMAEVAAISRATSAELERMTEVARQLGATTSFSAAQAAQGLKFLSQAGFTASESIEAIPDVLNLAKAASLELGTAADIASNVMSGFGIAATQAGEAADILAAISSRANTNVLQLGEAASFVGPVASAMGVSLGDASAAIGVLSDAGIQGSSAGTGLRRVLSSLANPTKEAERVLGSLGVSLAEVDPAANRLTDVISRLSQSGLSAADALTIFGDRGGPAVLALTANAPRVRELANQMESVSGEAERMAEIMDDTLSGDVKELTSSMSELALQLGDAGVTGALRSAVQGLTTMVRVIGFMTDEVQALFGVIKDDDVIRRLDKIAELEAKIENARNPAAINRYTNELLELQKAQKKWEEEQIRSIRGQRQQIELFDKAEKRLAVANLLVEEGVEILADMGESQAIANKESAEFSEKLQNIIDVANPAKAEIRDLTLAFDDMKRGVAEGKVATEDWAAFIDFALPEITVEAKRSTVYMDLLAEKTEEAAERSNKAWEGARGTLSNFFFELAADGNDAFDTLVEGAEAAINKIVAEFFASGLIGILQGKGFSGFDITATDAGALLGGGSNPLDLLSSGQSLASTGSSAVDFLKDPQGALDAITGLPDDISSFFKNNDWTSFTSAPSAVPLAEGGSSVVVRNSAGEVVSGAGGAGVPAGGSVNWATIGAGMAAGFVGTLAGQEIFQNEGSTGAGATVGGAIGAFTPLGPILGAGIGAFVGEGIEKVLGDIFGFGGGQSHNTVYQDISGGMRDGESFFTDKGLHGPQQESVGMVADLVESITDALGGSTFEAQLSASAKNGIEIDQAGGEFFRSTDTDTIFSEVFNRVLEGANNLDSNLKHLFSTFQGTGEETIQYADAVLASIGPQQKVSDSIVSLVETMGSAGEEGVEFAGTLFSVVDAEKEVTQSVLELITGFKGTGAETARLAGVLVNLSKEGAEVSSSVSSLISEFRGSGDEVSSFAAVLLSLSDSSQEVNSSIVDLIQGFGGSAEATISFTGEILSAVDASTELDSSFVSLISGFKGSSDRTIELTRSLLGLSTSTKVVDASLVSLIQNFEGVPDELISFSNALVGISNLLSTNPVEDAVSQFEASLESSGSTIAGAYVRQSIYVKDLAKDFDGSAASTEKLMMALGASTELAGQFAVVLERTKESIASLTTTTADYFRVSTLSEDQLQDKQVARLNELEEILASTLDPQVLESSFSEYTSLSKTLFDSLLDDINPRKLEEFGEEFAGNIESFGSLVQAKLEESEANLESSVGTQFELIDSMLAVHAASYESSSAAYQESSNRFATSVNKIERAAQQIAEAGSRLANANLNLTVNGQPAAGGDIEI